MIITIASNASSDLFPDNKIGNFRIQFSSEINLNGIWCCALARIQFPKSWSTLSGKDCTIIFNTFNDKTLFHTLTIDEAHYLTVNQLINQINLQIKKLANIIPQNKAWTVPKQISGTVFQVNDHGRVQIESDGNIDITLTEKMQAVLGFKTNVISIPQIAGKKRNVELAESMPNILAGVSSLWIYTDMIKEQYVSDVMAPLLFVVPTVGRFDEFLTFEPVTLDFLQLRSSRFQTVSFSIRDINGQIVKFSKGQVIITLHLRKL